MGTVSSIGSRPSPAGDPEARWRRREDKLRLDLIVHGRMTPEDAAVRARNLVDAERSREAAKAAEAKAPGLFGG